MSSVKVYLSQYMDVKKLFVKKTDGYINIACSHGPVPRAPFGSWPGTGWMGKLDLQMFSAWSRCPGVSVNEIQVKDLALYTHWPQHTKEFWKLLQA